MKLVPVVGSVLALALLGAPRTAEACGAAYPGGPVMCDYPRAQLYKDQPNGAAPASGGEAPTARLSASYDYTSTTILFGDGRRADLTRHAIFGGVELPIASRLSLQIGAGGIASGDLDHGQAHESIGPGFSGAVGVAWRVYDGKGAIPFILVGATISGTHMLTHTDGTLTDGTRPPGAHADTPDFTAFDLRASVVAGETFFEVLTPYVLARAFGGPVYWQYDNVSVTGTDLHHYQVGGGVSLALFQRRLDVFAEAAAGEVSLVGGIGTTFF